MPDDLGVSLENLYALELNSQDKEIFEKYVEITRYVQEVNSLFLIFRCNLTNILNTFELRLNGALKRNKNIGFTEDSYILVNAWTNNYISSARTLTESIEKWLKNNDVILFNKFKKDFLSKTYDEKFSYRFFNQIRNFTQHGHLAVDFDLEGKFCFDFRKILDVKNFSISSTMSKELESIKKEIRETYGDAPYISYVRTIAEYNLAITNIYNSFLNEIEPILNVRITSLNDLLKDVTDDLSAKNFVKDNLLIYDFEEETGILHVLDIKEYFKRIFLSIKEESCKILTQEKKFLQEIEMKSKK
ncbi:hypothetical protein K4422_10645 [Enterococcus sp. SMC-9]|nr:hypothetical protein [Enterococcus sp. SMC-9]